ncbi:ROK family protein [Shewanella khirikhana]|uniref:N-acetyl-D-glucosamine kinase n=1 Tax=Shewanella khirikhana TaxID=1965282 RepID=A0ABM7DSN8_9GAMM|nr:ROK family protein [Shewanella khirikhana]AZQ12723.1 N-acetyl-D-glucosamine kinase [Shewanella khirikhana]
MSVLCLDLGGTKLAIGRVAYPDKHETQTYAVAAITRLPVPQQADYAGMLLFLIQAIEPQLDGSVRGIAIGVPGTVSLQNGTLLEVMNLPCLIGKPLAVDLEARFQLPVSLNNDANLFALGESVLGNKRNLLGITLGTGVGAGVVFDGRLYSGKHCAAGEIGCFPYLDGIMEHYCSGQFFRRFAHCPGEQVRARALAGDTDALVLFQRFGEHLAELIYQTLLAYDPAEIVLGGSVSQAFSLFNDALWQRLAERADVSRLEGLSIRPSTEANAALIGAAHWFFQHQGESNHEMAVA